MPSFAKLTLAEPDLSTVFENETIKKRIETLRKDARARTFKIIESQIPAILDRLAEINAQAQDPSSALWPGHRSSKAFAPAKLELQAEKAKDASELVNSPPKKDDSALIAVNDDDDDDDAETAVGVSGSRFAPVWQGHLARNDICQPVTQIIMDQGPVVIMLCVDLEAWLMLEVPKIEDGNSFGTEIQEHILTEIKGLRSLCLKVMMLVQQHSTDRAELAMKWCRYPGLVDFGSSIATSDRLDHLLACHGLREIESHLGGLYVALGRNWDKVLNPKGTQDAAASMY